MKRLTIPLLVILAGVTFGGFLYGPAGMPGVFDVDSVKAPYFTSTDSLYWYNTNYFFYIRQAAATAGDRDLGLYFVEEDGTEHSIYWDDGSNRFNCTDTFRAASLYAGSKFQAGSSLEFNNSSATINTVVNGAGILLLGAPGDADTTDVPASCFLRLMSAPIFAEVATPTAIPNYAKIYPKTDNNLYFQDGAGSEHVVTLGSSDYAEMGNVYGSDATEALGSANEWHAMYHANINSGLISGFTFTAGSAGAGNITTAQGGAGINIADAAHGLVDGDIICVQSANHAGVDTVTYVDAGNFEITIAYVGDEAGTWQEGSYLECNTAGNYRGVWTSCMKQSLANAQTTIIMPHLNAEQATKAVALKYLTNANDVAAPAGNAIMTLAVGDRLWFAVQSTAAQTITFKVRNVSID